MHELIHVPGAENLFLRELKPNYIGANLELVWNSLSHGGDDASHTEAART